VKILKEVVIEGQTTQTKQKVGIAGSSGRIMNISIVTSDRSSRSSTHSLVLLLYSLLLVPPSIWGFLRIVLPIVGSVGSTMIAIGEILPTLNNLLGALVTGNQVPAIVASSFTTILSLYVLGLNLGDDHIAVSFLSIGQG
jgi:hypothetical protein